MTFSIRFDPCRQCNSGMNSFPYDKTCIGCGKIYRHICENCANEPCPECGKSLFDKDELYPHNLYKAISEGNESLTEKIYCENYDQITDEIHENALVSAAQFLIKDKDVAYNLCQILIINGGGSIQTKHHSIISSLVSSRIWKKNIYSLFLYSINNKDKKGKTALMYAAENTQGAFGQRKGNISIAVDLIELGADALIQDSKGRTALWYAVRSNDTNKNNEMVNLLKTEMAKQTAYKYFSESYNHSFNENGVLEKIPKKT